MRNLFSSVMVENIIIPDSEKHEVSSLTIDNCLYIFFKK